MRSGHPVDHFVRFNEYIGRLTERFFPPYCNLLENASDSAKTILKVTANIAHQIQWPLFVRTIVRACDEFGGGGGEEDWREPNRVVWESERKKFTRTHSAHQFDRTNSRPLLLYAIVILHSELASTNLGLFRTIFFCTKKLIRYASLAEFVPIRYLSIAQSCWGSGEEFLWVLTYRTHKISLSQQISICLSLAHCVPHWTKITFRSYQNLAVYWPVVFAFLTAKCVKYLRTHNLESFRRSLSGTRPWQNAESLSGEYLYRSGSFAGRPSVRPIIELHFKHYRPANRRTI